MPLFDTLGIAMIFTYSKTSAFEYVSHYALLIGLVHTHQWSNGVECGMQKSFLRPVAVKN